MLISPWPLAADIRSSPPHHTNHYINHLEWKHLSTRLISGREKKSSAYSHYVSQRTLLEPGRALLSMIAHNSLLIWRFFLCCINVGLLLYMSKIRPVQTLESDQLLFFLDKASAVKHQCTDRHWLLNLLSKVRFKKIELIFFITLGFEWHNLLYFYIRQYWKDPKLTDLQSGFKMPHCFPPK